MMDFPSLTNENKMYMSRCIILGDYQTIPSSFFQLIYRQVYYFILGRKITKMVEELSYV